MELHIYIPDRGDNVLVFEALEQVVDMMLEMFPDRGIEVVTNGEVVNRCPMV